jgi:hypothetical protein
MRCNSNHHHHKNSYLHPHLLFGEPRRRRRHYRHRFRFGVGISFCMVAVVAGVVPPPRIRSITTTTTTMMIIIIMRNIRTITITIVSIAQLLLPVISRPDRTEHVLRELHSYTEEWVGFPLVAHQAYGFRVYRNESQLHRKRSICHWKWLKRQCANQAAQTIGVVLGKVQLSGADLRKRVY